MRIALLHYAANPIVGGVENVIRQHSRMMAAAGHRVVVIAGRGEQLDPGVEFAPFPLADSQSPEVLDVKANLDQGRVPSAFGALVQRIETSLRSLLTDADCAIAHNVCSLSKNLALTAAVHRIAHASASPAWILWHHDLAWKTDRYSAELHPGFPWDLLRKDLPEARQVTVSEYRRRQLAELLGIGTERIQVIPNGIDATRFLKLGKQTQSLLEELRLQDASPLVLMPVRITARKNVEDALRILSALRRHYPAAQLVITGPKGPHNEANAAYLRSLLTLLNELKLEQHAVFLALTAAGEISDETIADLYRLADLLLLPSKEEGFGIPVLEAGLVGVPVFCADIPPLRELGEDGVEYIQPDESPQSVADRIKHVLAGSRRHRLRRRILEKFTWPQVYSQHISPLLETVEK